MAINGEAATTLTTCLLGCVSRTNILSITHGTRQVELPVIATVETKTEPVRINALSVQPGGQKYVPTEANGGYALTRYVLQTALQQTTCNVMQSPRTQLLRLLLERPVLDSLRQLRGIVASVGESAWLEDVNTSNIATKMLAVIGAALVHLLKAVTGADKLEATWIAVHTKDNAVVRTYSLDAYGAHPLGAEQWFMDVANRLTDLDVPSVMDEGEAVLMLNTCIVPILLANWKHVVAQDAVMICG